MVLVKINYASVFPIIKITYDETPVYIKTSINNVYAKVVYGGGGGISSVSWGDIDGTLSDQTDLQNALNAKVPYSGATANVDLGEYELKAGQIELDQSPTGIAGVAVTRWNDTIGSTETTLKGGSVILKNGVDLVARVVNKVSSNTTLTKAAYQAVRISGAQGQRLAVELAQANNDNNSADTIGLVTETISPNQEGFIMTVGSLEGINSTGSLQGETWSDGDVLYLSPTTAGRITNIKPIAPQHLVVIGYVEYAHQNNGKIYVKVMNGWELGELHDVDTSGATNGQVLKYNGSIWVPATDSAGTGTVTSVAATAGTGISVSGSPITTSGTLTITNTAPDQTVSLTQGGTTTITGIYPNFTISSADQYTGTVTSVGLTSSTTGLTITNSPVTTSGNLNLDIATASGSVNGLLSSTDWSTFNGKQNAITLTTTGTSGAATLVGNTLNIPQYSGGGSMAIGGTVTGGTTGSVLFVGASSALAQDNTNFFWDDSNNRLGIGTATPLASINVVGDAVQENIWADRYVGAVGAAAPTIILRKARGTSASPSAAQSGDFLGVFGFRGYGATAFSSGSRAYLAAFAAENWTDTSQGTYFAIGTTANGTASASVKMQIFGNGNTILQNGGTFTDAGYRLDVNGTARVNGSTTFGTLGTGTGMFWDNTNNCLGIGTTTPSASLEINSTSVTYRGITITQSSNDAVAPPFVGRKIRGTSAVINTDNLFTFSGQGYDGANYQTGAAIRLLVDGAVSSGVVPTAIEFRTGSSALGTTRLSIASGGNVTFTGSSFTNRFTAAGRLLLGTTTESTFLLDVNGTARVSGILTFTDASTGGTGSLYIGVGDVSPFGGNRNIIIGNTGGVLFGAGTRNVAIGSVSITNGTSNTVTIGNSASTTGSSAIAILGTAAANSIGIGGIANVTNTVVLGSIGSGKPTASGQMVLGMTDIYIRTVNGDGATQQNATNATLNGPGAFGTNYNGGNLTIASGKGTGTGTGGDLIFQTPTTGTSGTTLQTLTERLRIKNNIGSVRFFPIATPATAEAGDVYYDSTTNKLRCYNGTTWNDLF